MQCQQHFRRQAVGRLGSSVTTPLAIRSPLHHHRSLARLSAHQKPNPSLLFHASSPHPSRLLINHQNNKPHAKSQSTQTPSPVSNAHESWAKRLTSSFAEKSKATFACGRLLNIDESNAKDDDSAAQQASTPPVIIRFGPDGKGRHLVLPSPDGDSPQFQSLLSACEPASFGVGGEAVMDESYRKAAKLDPNSFCTDFCPYTLGIVGIVNQFLVPSVQEKRSVKVSLYSLNIYSGPSGKFKADVDTPRSDVQIGSLVDDDDDDDDVAIFRAGLGPDVEVADLRGGVQSVGL
jgi:hypothetical protein